MVAHEIVHLIGRTHEEALVIDHEVRGRDWLGTASGSLVLGARGLFSDNLGEWSRLTPWKYGLIKNGKVDKLKLCMALAVMDEGYDHLGLGFGYGIMAPIYRFDQKILASIIFGKVVNLMGVCIENHPNDVFGKNSKIPNEISMRKYFKLFSPNTAFPSRQYETSTSTRIMGADFDKHLFRHEVAIDYSALGSDYDRYVTRRLTRDGVMDSKAIESELDDIVAITQKIKDYLLEY